MNPLLKDPIKVIIYNPLSNTTNIRTYVFVGNVPKNIKDAINRYSKRKNKSDGNILKNYYGAGFVKKLAFGNVGGYENNIIGGANEFSDELTDPLDDTISITNEDLALDIEIDNISSEKDEDVSLDIKQDEELPIDNTSRDEAKDDDEIIITENELNLQDIEKFFQAQEDETQTTRSIQIDPETISIDTETDLDIEFEPGTEYIFDIDVYPEDKIFELREKIQLVTGVPIYRQHLFNIVAGRPKTTYKIYTDTTIIVDIMQLKKVEDNIVGVPIDRAMYFDMQELKVEAYDEFRIVKHSFDHTYYLVDLNMIMKGKRGAILDIINDTYQFDLLYYGFVLKYFPVITKEMFQDYINDEADLRNIYTLVTKPQSRLSTRFKEESKIINSIYCKKSEMLSIAITQMLATISVSNAQINIRNLFDIIPTSRCIPEIIAFVEHNNNKYLLRKRHIFNKSSISFPVSMRSGLTFAISLRKADQDSYHKRVAKLTVEDEQSRYLFVNIQPEGTYHVRSTWNEEDQFDFPDVIKIMKIFVNPLIKEINKVGNYAFSGNDRLVEISQNNITYSNLNICLFWKKLIIGNHFKIIRSLFEPWSRAGIVATRGVIGSSSANSFDLMFKKGMYDFDISTVDRILNSRDESNINNHYLYLSNPNVNHRHKQFTGRYTRIYHRTTDIKFEVYNIREEEFETFEKYISYFVMEANKNSSLKDISSTPSASLTKKITKLKETDPNLYNLKKFGNKKVYAKICQNKFQPTPFTDEEVNKMSKQEKDKLTEYWNFTLNRPQYYGCTSKQYPHITFTTNDHPLGYCLPCCKKIKSAPDSKKAKIHQICLDKHSFKQSDLKTDIDASRHIMSYSKDIDLGRLAKTPAGTFNDLLYNTLEPDLNYYILGVGQNVPAMANTGMIYTIANALEISVADFARKCISFLRKHNDLFYILLSGKLVKYFYNINNLNIAIRVLFINEESAISYSERCLNTQVDILAFHEWNKLFAELVIYTDNIYVIELIDKEALEKNIKIYISNQVHASMLYKKNVIENTLESTNTKIMNNIDNEKYLVTMQILSQIYPIYAVNAGDYYNTGSIDKKLFDYDDKIIKIMYSVVLYDRNKLSEYGANRPHELYLVQAFINNNPKYKIVKKFINRNNLCYSLLIQVNSEYIYLPISYITNIPDKIKITFDAFNRANYKCPEYLLFDFIAQFNKYIAKINKNSDKLYEIIVPVDYFKYNDSFIGFKDRSNLIYYFNDVKELSHLGKQTNTLPQANQIVVKYDYNKVNEQIAKNMKPNIDNNKNKLGRALYNNYAYQLFVIEFINYISKEKNTTLRTKIYNILKSGKCIEASENINKLKNLLVDYPLDYKSIKMQITTLSDKKICRKEIIDTIKQTKYDFDKVTYDKLKQMEHKDIVKELQKIMDNIIVKKKLDKESIEFPNIYLPCEYNKKQPFCFNGKLIINPQDYINFIDLLAADIKNPNKEKYLLSNLFLNNNINYLRFQRRKYEKVIIYNLI